MRKHEKNHYKKNKKHQTQSNAYSSPLQYETTNLFSQNETQKDMINTPEHMMLFDFNEISRVNIYS